MFIIVSVIIGTISILSIAFLLQFRFSLSQLFRTSTEIMSQDLHAQMEKRAEVLTYFLAENLVNPVYQHDMEAIYELLKATREQADVLYVYVYDTDGRIIHDGTRQISSYGKHMDEGAGDRGNELSVSLPIRIGDSPLGGVKVGLSLKNIEGDISQMTNHYMSMSDEGLRSNVIILVLAALSMSFLGVLVSRHVAGNLIRPIRMLVGYTRNIGRGNYDTHISFRSNDEIGELVEAFTQMHQDLQQTTVSKQYVKNIIASMKDALTVLSPEGAIVMVNRAFDDLLDVQREELINKPFEMLFPKRNLPEVKRWLAELTSRGIAGAIDSEYITKIGKVVPISLSGAVMYDDDGEVRGFICVAQDITERKQAEDRLQFLAHFDSLTNLPNRTLLIDRMNQEIARTHWHKRLMAVLFLDLDRFKVINDTLGHTVGDQLLKEVAQRLTDCVREGDTVSRLGGDEFVILLVDLGDVRDVPVVAKKITGVFSRPFLLNNMEYFITVSIGISIYPNDSEDGNSLMKYADIAMYGAKKQGRNRYQLYSPAMNIKASERLTLEAKLHYALEREEFHLCYQPKINLNNGQITGSEALLRWENPEIGVISPAEFVPLLEETGLIVPVGEWILRTACLHNKTWQQAGFPHLTVGVNFSSLQFKHHNLCETLVRILKETGLDPHCLEVELTESILMESTEEIVGLLHELNAMGVHISLDDFGTGYSSLSYLRRFPIHSLKIDRSFIRDVTTNPEDTAITQAIIAMAHSLKLRVVAEGVETEEQLALLIENGCDEMQGYYFSKPLPFDAFTSLLKDGRKII